MKPGCLCNLDICGVKSQNSPAEYLSPPNLCVSQIKLPIPSMPSSESLLRTDSLSSTEPVLSDGSVGSAPSLGLSPGPSTGMDISRNELNQMQEKIMEQEEKADEVTSNLSIYSDYLELQ